MTLNPKSVNTTRAAVTVFCYVIILSDVRQSSLALSKCAPAHRLAGGLVLWWLVSLNIYNALGTECCSSVSNTKVFIKSQLGLLLC